MIYMTDYVIILILSKPYHDRQVHNNFKSFCLQYERIFQTAKRSITPVSKKFSQPFWGTLLESRLYK